MKLSDQGYFILQDFEGLSCIPYLDAVGVPTIGFGNTYYADGTRVKISDCSITVKQAEELLKLITHKFEKAVDNLGIRLEQNQFDALVIFAYNVGIGALNNSTLVKRIKEDTLHPSIPNEWTKWTKAGGKMFKGLAKRRLREVMMYYINEY